MHDQCHHPNEITSEWLLLLELDRSDFKQVMFSVFLKVRLHSVSWH